MDKKSAYKLLALNYDKRSQQMQALLKAKAEKWKNKALSRTQSARKLRARLLRQEQRISELESEISSLKQIVTPIQVSRHTYPAQLIALAVFIVVQGNGSLRCAAKTVAFVAYMLGWDYSQPSHVSVRNWTLRCGLYRLQKGSQTEQTYVGIIDESIQIGQEKLLLLLGIRQDKQVFIDGPLQMKDTRILGIQVQKSWKSDAVRTFIERTLSLHNIGLCYMISDKGSSLVAACKKLGLPRVSDCTHMMMNAVKHQFANDKELARLVASISKLRQKMSLTDIAWLLPPKLRDKERFLHIFIIVDWVKQVNKYWCCLSDKQKEQLAFIKNYPELIEQLSQARHLIKITAEILKNHGLSYQSKQKWDQRIAAYSQMVRLSTPSKNFICTVRTYFNNHQAIIQKYQQVRCCSDIIESTFGRYKNKGKVNVISADVLSITLYNQQITTGFIQKALATINYEQLIKWQQKHICENRFTIIKRYTKAIKSVN